MNVLDTSLIRLKGFDRRGCVASLNTITVDSFKITGEFSDPADFVVAFLHRALDRDGHLYTNKYLPAYNLDGVVFDFDLSGTGFQFPTSLKFQSVPWGKVSYILKDGTSGTFPLNITSVTGGVKASGLFTVTSPGPAAFDRVQLVYLGNTIYDYVVVGGDTTTDIAASLVTQINTSTDIEASNVTNAITVKYRNEGTDGNNIAIFEMHKNANTTIVPSANTLLTGGTNPTSCHISLDFTGILGANATQVQELWITIAPIVNTITGYTRQEFSYEITNWAVSGTVVPVLYADQTQSVVIKAKDYNVTYLGNWEEVSDNWYNAGFARRSSTTGDQFVVSYYCQYTHDLYCSFACGSLLGFGTFTIDGGSPFTRYTGFNISPPESCRQILQTGLSAGPHTIVFTVLSGSITFDFLHAVIPISTPLVRTLDTGITSAADFDTGFTNQVSPQYFVQRHVGMGFGARLDFYGGVFFAHRRRRRGGFYPTVECTITGPLDFGDSFGGGTADSWFITIGGTTLGATTFPFDTVDTLSQRLCNAINSTFVAVLAFPTGAPGVFQIQVTSPINAFSFSSSYSSTGGTLVSTGSLENGNEGIWEIDDLALNPLTRGYLDYVTDLYGELTLAEIGLTISHSQELLAPPDFGGIGTTWIQRYFDGTTVLTATGFGQWGVGFVGNVAGTTITQFGHGYSEGYRWHGASGSTAYAFVIDSIVDVDNFILGLRLDSGSDLPQIGDSVFVELQTSQCAFSNVVSTYMGSVYANLPVGPWLQLGEILHWFFAGGFPLSMAFYDFDQDLAANVALGRSLDFFAGPDSDPSLNGFADADFLLNRLSAYLVNVTGAVPGATWELLYPNDVNFRISYQSPNFPFPLGGRLNRYINLPSSCYNNGGPIQKIAIEDLAWLTSYRNIDLSKESVVFAQTAPMAWALGNTSYFISWDNGGTAWNKLGNFALDKQIPRIVYWAGDHIVLLSWNLDKLLPRTRTY